MTTTRIVRGTKTRIILGICAVVFVTGILACYNNARVELDNARRTIELNRQEQESLSSQLQVLYDYKQRLEKSLTVKRGELQNAATEYEEKLKDLQMKNEKINSDVKLQLATLQQHYNLLQTKHEDFKEECSKAKHDQLDEVNALRAKLSEIQEELKQIGIKKDTEIEEIRLQLKHANSELRKFKPSENESQKNDIQTTSTHSAKGDQLLPEDTQHKYQPQELEKEMNVLAKPDEPKSKSSTPSNVALPLKEPTVTPETIKKSSSTPEPKKFEVPDGVVPAPNNFADLKADEKEENNLNFNAVVQEHDNAAHEDVNNDKMNKDFDNNDVDYEDHNENEDDDNGDGARNPVDPVAIRD